MNTKSAIIKTFSALTIFSMVSNINVAAWSNEKTIQTKKYGSSSTIHLAENNTFKIGGFKLFDEINSSLHKGINLYLSKQYPEALTTLNETERRIDALKLPRSSQRYKECLTAKSIIQTYIGKIYIEQHKIENAQECFRLARDSLFQGDTSLAGQTPTILILAQNSEDNNDYVEALLLYSMCLSKLNNYKDYQETEIIEQVLSRIFRLNEIVKGSDSNKLKFTHLSSKADQYCFIELPSKTQPKVGNRLIIINGESGQHLAAGILIERSKKDRDPEIIKVFEKTIHNDTSFNDKWQAHLCEIAYESRATKYRQYALNALINFINMKASHSFSADIITIYTLAELNSHFLQKDLGLAETCRKALAEMCQSQKIATTKCLIEGRFIYRQEIINWLINSEDADFAISIFLLRFNEKEPRGAYMEFTGTMYQTSGKAIEAYTDFPNTLIAERLNSLALKYDNIDQSEKANELKNLAKLIQDLPKDIRYPTWLTNKTKSSP